MTVSLGKKTHYVRSNMKIWQEIKRNTAKEKQSLDLHNYQNMKRNEVR